VDRLLDEASLTADDDRRRALYGDVQRVLAEEQPYLSLWCKTNVAVAQRTLTGFRIPPTAEFTFLKDVARTPPDARARR
jgi:peptide/nickel transport system substrate-binding protein